MRARESTHARGRKREHVLKSNQTHTHTHTRAHARTNRVKAHNNKIIIVLILFVEMLTDVVTYCNILQHTATQTLPV